MNHAIRERAAHLFAALSHPTRLSIVDLLEGGGLTVNEIAVQLRIGQSSASQHLAVLARSGILTAAPRGSARVYTLRGPRVGQILVLIEEFCSVHELYGAASESAVDE